MTTGNCTKLVSIDCFYLTVNRGRFVGCKISLDRVSVILCFHVGSSPTPTLFNLYDRRLLSLVILCGFFSPSHSGWRQMLAILCLSTLFCRILFPRFLPLLLLLLLISHISLGTPIVVTVLQTCATFPLCMCHMTRTSTCLTGGLWPSFSSGILLYTVSVFLVYHALSRFAPLLNYSYYSSRPVSVS